MDPFAMTDHDQDPYHSQNYGKDPLEAIYALNIGDFVAESFISDELLDKISARLGSDPEKLNRQLEELIQIYSMEKTLSILGFQPSQEFVFYDSIAATLQEMFQVDVCHLFQTAPRTFATPRQSDSHALLLTGTSQEVPAEGRQDMRLPLAAGGILDDAYWNNKTLVVDSVAGLPGWTGEPKQLFNQVRSFLITPMYEGKKPMGMLLFGSHKVQSFSQELVQLSKSTARLFVTGIRLQQLLADAEADIRNPDSTENNKLNLRAQITESIADLGIYQQEFMADLANAIDARYHFTHGHSRQVATIAQNIAEALNLNEKTVDLIEYAGLLGNLGKIHIPKEILAKRENLTSDEWESLRNHPNVGVGLLLQINFLSEVVPYVHSKQERWDGSGAPEGLSGQSIPLGSRILAVADAYHAMTRERPYREKPLTHKEAMATLQREAGIKWDPLVVEALAKIPEASLK